MNSAISLNYPDQETLLKQILALEETYKNTSDHKILFSLGKSWRDYNEWFIRGDNKKEYYLKAISYIEKAISLTYQKPDETIINQRLLFDWEIYALYLAALLVEEPCVRDLDKAISIFEGIYKTTTHYEANYCHYADAIYKKGDYEQAAQIGEELHIRAVKYFRDSKPTMPLDVAAKSYRALIRLYKQQKDISNAIKYSKKLIATDRATTNDITIDEKLRNMNAG